MFFFFSLLSRIASKCIILFANSWLLDEAIHTKVMPSNGRNPKNEEKKKLKVTNGSDVQQNKNQKAEHQRHVMKKRVCARGTSQRRLRLVQD